MGRSQLVEVHHAPDVRGHLYHEQFTDPTTNMSDQQISQSSNTVPFLQRITKKQWLQVLFGCSMLGLGVSMLIAGKYSWMLGVFLATTGYFNILENAVSLFFTRPEDLAAKKVDPIYKYVYKHIIAAFVDFTMLGTLFGALGFAYFSVVNNVSVVRTVTTEHGSTINFMIGVMSFVILASWFIMFESSRFRATPGKMLIGIQVLTTDGQQLTLEQAAKRFLFKTITSIPLLLGVLFCAFHSKKQTLYDLMSGTQLSDRGETPQQQPTQPTVNNTVTTQDTTTTQLSSLMDILSEGDQLYGNHELTRTLELLNTMINDNQTDATAYYRRGILKAEMNDLDGARQDLAKVKELALSK